MSGSFIVCVFVDRTMACNPPQLKQIPIRCVKSEFSGRPSDTRCDIAIHGLSSRDLFPFIHQSCIDNSVAIAWSAVLRI